MKALTYLVLSNTNLNAIPEEFGDLTQMQELYLGANQLTQLPAGLSKLTNLTILALNNNRLSGNLSGATFAGMTKLKYLNVSTNQLDGALPPELFALPVLEVLRLTENKFSGPMPNAASAAKLTNLDVSSNRLTALPSDLGSLKRLTELTEW